MTPKAAIWFFESYALHAYSCISSGLSWGFTMPGTSSCCCLLSSAAFLSWASLSSMNRSPGSSPENSYIHVHVHYNYVLWSALKPRESYLVHLFTQSRQNLMLCLNSSGSGGIHQAINIMATYIVTLQKSIFSTREFENRRVIMMTNGGHIPEISNHKS